MNGKSFAAGLLAAYGFLTFLSLFGVSLIFSLPVVVAGIDVGRLVVAIILLGCAYYLAK